jgi:hypothetical protein
MGKDKMNKKVDETLNTQGIDPNMVNQQDKEEIAQDMET